MSPTTPVEQKRLGTAVFHAAETNLTGALPNQQTPHMASQMLAFSRHHSRRPQRASCQNRTGSHTMARCEVTFTPMTQTITHQTHQLWHLPQTVPIHPRCSSKHPPGCLRRKPANHHPQPAQPTAGQPVRTAQATPSPQHRHPTHSSSPKLLVSTCPHDRIRTGIPHLDKVVL